MILIALGANLPSRYGSPAQTLVAARDALAQQGVVTVKSSRIWLTAPVPFDPDQDWYHNAVIAVETSLLPHDLLSTMLKIEAEFGRVRSVKNAPRLLDLDLIAYEDEVIKDGDNLIVPHPRMHERLFVLRPLEDISNKWTHPIFRKNTIEMLRGLPSGVLDAQEAKPLESDVAEGEVYAW